MNFQLTSIMDEIGDNKLVVLYLTVNGKTYNCANAVSSFKDAESCIATLIPTITTLVKHAYGTNKDELA